MSRCAAETDAAPVVIVVDVLTAASSTDVERARLLLVHEGAAGTAAECALAAGRVYDKLFAHLSPLLGPAGVRALLVRSAKLIERRFSFLDAVVVEGSSALHECLRAQHPAVAAESAAVLFGTFFALSTKFIGERLTTEALRRAWPTIEETTPSGTTVETEK